MSHGTPILLRWLALRHYRRHRLRSLLALTSIVVGVATYVSMSALNRGTLESFARTAQSRAADADLVVRSGQNGVPAALAEVVTAVAGVRGALPLILSSLPMQTPAGEFDTLLVVGLDPVPAAALSGMAGEDLLRDLADPLALVRMRRPLVIGEAWARRHQIEIGAELTCIAAAGPTPVQVAGFLGTNPWLDLLGDAVAVCPQSVAQELLGRGERVDRILVYAEAGVAPELLQIQLQEVVGAQAVVATPLEEAREFDKVLGSVRLALEMLSMLSLLIAAFLVHSTLEMALTERRRELATLRCLGLPAASLRLLLLGEAGCLGLLGAVPGVLVGGLLARTLAGTFWSTIGNIFDRIQPADLEVSGFEMGVGLLTGLLAALLAAWGPARAAMRSSPLTGLRRQAPQPLRARSRRRKMLASAVMLGGVLISLQQDGFGIPQAGYATILLLLAAVTVGAYPLLSLVTQRVGGVFLRFLGPGARLARDHFERSEGSSGMTLAAISLGFGVVFSTHILVHSFEDLLDHWFQRTVQEDLFVMDRDFLQGGLEGASFDRSLLEEVRAIAGVRHVHPMRFQRVLYGGQRIMIMALDGAAPREAGAFLYIDGEPADRRRLARGEGVFVSEGFAYLQQVARGEFLTLATPGGPREFEVLAVVEDYTWPLGSVIFDDDLYVAAFEDPFVHEFAVTLDGSRSKEEVRRELSRRFLPEYPAVVMTDDELKRTVMGTLRGFWSLFVAQESLAVFVAFLGTLQTLLISVMLRRREIGLLRAVGAPLSVVSRMIRVEGTLLGLAGGVFGVLFGRLVAHVALGMLSLEEQGYRTPASWSVWVLLATVAGAAFTGWLAGLYPSREAARTDVLDAIAED